MTLTKTVGNSLGAVTVFWPNSARHRIAARLRFGKNLKGPVWAARGTRMVWTPPREVSVKVGNN